MYLGISSSLEHSSPQDWAKKHKALGLQTVNFPVNCDDGEETFMAYKKAADEAGLTIAEVGVWRNTLAADPEERQHWIDYAIRQLRMADAIGAACCVNVVGTPYGPRWDGGYRENFSTELWNMAVSMIRQIIDTARPRHTKFCIESMPWMIPSGPDEYLRLIEAVDRTEFGTHLDVVNMITSPKRYFFNDEFLDECFEKLGPLICSCHLKDIAMEEKSTVHIYEVLPGLGQMDIAYYLKRIQDLGNPDMPVLIEHLPDRESYQKAMDYVRNVVPR